jgi:hypothetical protein
MLLVVVSIPFWLVGAAPVEIVPRVPLIDLPMSALVAFAPAIAAVILVARERGLGGARELLARAFDYRRITDRRWYLPMIFLMPLLMVIEFGVMRLLGWDVPDPQFAPALLLFFAIFFVTAVGEEVGWTGYATEPLLARWSALTAGLVLGGIWALWHLVSFLQTTDDLTWVFWQSANTVGLRVLIVWLFINTGRSVFAAVVFHMMTNVSEFSFPVYGSHYDPFSTTVLVGIAIVVTRVMGDG